MGFEPAESQGPLSLAFLTDDVGDALSEKPAPQKFSLRLGDISNDSQRYAASIMPIGIYSPLALSIFLSIPRSQVCSLYLACLVLWSGFQFFSSGVSLSSFLFVSEAVVYISIVLLLIYGGFSSVCIKCRAFFWKVTCTEFQRREPVLSPRLHLFQENVASIHKFAKPTLLFSMKENEGHRLYNNEQDMLEWLDQVRMVFFILRVVAVPFVSDEHG